MTESSNLNAFFTIWKESIVAVLSGLGVTDAFAVLSPSAAPPASEAVPVRILLEGGLKGQVRFSAAPVVAGRLAQLPELRPGDTESTGDHRDAFAEFFRRVAASVASAWKARAGSEIQLNVQATPGGSFVPAGATEINLSGGAIGQSLLQLQVDQQLCDSLGAAAGAPAAVSAGVSAPSAPPDSASTATSSPDAQADLSLAKATAALPQNIDLLLDVELEATIRFGAREMLLRDIFGLMPGAVVELDQIVNEPVDLLVAGRLIARGEVVVVDGNFGLRVSEVATPSQRAEVLRL
jgi:flagellar motor switch protein FliN/FliY